MYRDRYEIDMLKTFSSCPELYEEISSHRVLSGVPVIARITAKNHMCDRNGMNIPRNNIKDKVMIMSVASIQDELDGDVQVYMSYYYDNNLYLFLELSEMDIFTSSHIGYDTQRLASLLASKETYYYIKAMQSFNCGSFDSYNNGIVFECRVFNIPGVALHMYIEHIRHHGECGIDGLLYPDGAFIIDGSRFDELDDNIKALVDWEKYGSMYGFKNYEGFGNHDKLIERLIDKYRIN